MSTRANRLAELTAPGLRNHFVYLVHDADDNVIYVGCTRVPESRWRAHRLQNKDMVAEAQGCRMSGPYDYTTARTLEAHLIHVHQPRFNRYGLGYIEDPSLDRSPVVAS